MREFAIFIIGIIAGFLILYFLKPKKQVENEQISKDILNLLKTQEAKNILLSDNFKQLLKTKEFAQLAKDYGKQELFNLITV